MLTGLQSHHVVSVDDFGLVDIAEPLFYDTAVASEDLYNIGGSVVGEPTGDLATFLITAGNQRTTAKLAFNAGNTDGEQTTVAVTQATGRA